MKKKLLIVLTMSVMFSLMVASGLTVHAGPGFEFEEQPDTGWGTSNPVEDNWVVKTGYEAIVRNLSGNDNFGPTAYYSQYFKVEIYVRPIEGLEVDVRTADELYMRYKNEYGSYISGFFKIDDCIYNLSDIPEDSNGNPVPGIYYWYTMDQVLVTYETYGQMQSLHPENRMILDHTYEFDIFTYIGDHNVEFNNTSSQTWRVFTTSIGTEKVMIWRDLGTSLEYFIFDDNSTDFNADITPTPGGEGYLIDISSTLNSYDADSVTNGEIYLVIVII